MNTEELRGLLESKSTNKYVTFNQNLIPGARPSIGVNIPVLRQIAREIAKNDPLTFLETTPLHYHEEALLYAFVLGYLKAPVTTKFPYIASFLPLVNDWAVCDGLISTLKFKTDEKEVMWNFLIPYTKCDHHFSLRFVSVMYLSYFLDDEYIDKVIKQLENLESENYYSKMGVAWLISVIMVKYPTKALLLLTKSNLSTWTINKAIQKIKESFRIDDDLKIAVQKLKRNK